MTGGDVDQNIRLLREIEGKISSIGLKTQIRSHLSILQEDVAILALKWLNDLPENVVGIKTTMGVTYPSCQTLVRYLIAQTLQRPPRRTEAGEVENIAQSFLISTLNIWKLAAKTLKDTLLSSFIFLGDDMKRWLGI